MLERDMNQWKNSFHFYSLNSVMEKAFKMQDFLASMVRKDSK